MKKALIVGLSFFAATACNAQTTVNAAQTVNLNLTDAIEIVFVGSGTATGVPVDLFFNTMSDYTNGVTSLSQQLSVKSNKKFSVSVKSNAPNFTYTGSVSPAPSMSVASTLNIKVSANSTGGTVTSPFSTTTFTNINSGDRTMITNGNAGNSNFSIQYQATPGFNYPAGVYSVDVIYTATQS